MVVVGDEMIEYKSIYKSESELYTELQKLKVSEVVLKYYGTTELSRSIQKEAIKKGRVFCVNIKCNKGVSIPKEDMWFKYVTYNLELLEYVYYIRLHAYYIKRYDNKHISKLKFLSRLLKNTHINAKIYANRKLVKDIKNGVMQKEYNEEEK